MQRNLALNGLKWEPASLHLFPSWPLVWIWNPCDPRLRPLMKPLTSTGPLRDACSMISSPNIRRCQLEIAKFNANSILQIWSGKCNMAWGPCYLFLPVSTSDSHTVFPQIVSAETIQGKKLRGNTVIKATLEKDCSQVPSNWHPLPDTPLSAAEVNLTMARRPTEGAPKKEASLTPNTTVSKIKRPNIDGQNFFELVSIVLSYINWEMRAWMNVFVRCAAIWRVFELVWCEWLHALCRQSFKEKDMVGRLLHSINGNTIKYIST